MPKALSSSVSEALPKGARGTGISCGERLRAYASSQGAGNKDCSALTHRHSHRSFSRRETNASRLTPLSKGGGNPCTEVAPEGNKDCSAASPRRCLAQRRDKIIFMQEVYSKVNSRGFPDAIKKNLYKTFLYKSVPSSRVLFR